MRKTFHEIYMYLVASLIVQNFKIILLVDLDLQGCIIFEFCDIEACVILGHIVQELHILPKRGSLGKFHLNNFCQLIEP